jgi:ATP phosphoribosyltransferase regulatory subunit
MNSAILENLLYESDSDPIGLPSGVIFFSGKQMEEIDALSLNLEKMVNSAGFLKVVPPAFEYYETFEKGGGADIARKAFSFKDKDGKLLSLRYDMTTPIARMAAMKYNMENLPLRFYYNGDVYREQPLHKGKFRQIKQIGIEIVGISGIDADAETVDLLGKTLSLVNEDYRIVLGDISLYKNVLNGLSLNQTQIQAIHVCLDRKDRVSLTKILDHIDDNQKEKNILLELPNLTGRADEIDKKLDDWPDRKVYCKKLFDLISLLPKKLKEHIVVDLGLIKDFSYYSSLTMEGYAGRFGYPIASGGRYDDLFKAFGKDFPAVGFAIDMSFIL